MTSEFEKSTSNLNRRKQQMLSLIEYRPFWLVRGTCTNEVDKVYKANSISCPCDKANFSCQVYALTKREKEELIGLADVI